MGKLKNGKAAGEGEAIGEMMKGRGKMVVNRIWRLCNMVIEIGKVLDPGDLL